MGLGRAIPLRTAPGIPRSLHSRPFRERKGQRGVAHLSHGGERGREVLRRLFHREGGRNGTPLSHGERGANERSDVSGVCPRGREGVWVWGVGMWSPPPHSPGHTPLVALAPLSRSERGREVLHTFLMAAKGAERCCAPFSSRRGQERHAPFAWRKGRERAKRCERGMPRGGVRGCGCGRRGACGMWSPPPHSPGHTPLVALAPLSRAKGAERCCAPFSWREGRGRL